MNSTPEFENNNWFRFDEKDTTPEWLIEDPDSCEEDDYSETSSPYDE